MPQVPTARGIKIRSAADAHLILYAVHLGRLPIIQRRLDATERREVVSGAVFIWEERSAATLQTNSGINTDPDDGPPQRVVSGIERWTEGLKWGPSRVRDDFLFYQEKDSNDRDTVTTPPPHNDQNLYRSHSSKRSGRLVKQTYSVHYHPQILQGEPPVNPARKWHLTAYHSPGLIDRLADVTSVPELQSITAPEGLFKKARVEKKRKIPPANSHSTSSSQGATVSISNAPDNACGVSSVSSPDCGPGTGYGGGINEVPTGLTSVIGTFGAFENGMQPTDGMPPPHPHSHHHHVSSSSGYGLGGHSRQASMDIGTPQIGHQLPAPNAPQQRFGQPEHPGHQHHSSTEYAGHYDPRYGSQPPPPAVHSHGHSHSHGGSIGYNDSYTYGNDYGHPGKGNNGYGYDRDWPYGAAGRLSPHQLAPSAGAVSDTSYDPSRPPALHHASTSVSPPISQLQHQHHRSHSHSYSNGHVLPSTKNGTPLMQYGQSQSQNLLTPMQQHSVPQPPMPTGHGHRRSHLTSSEIGLDGVNEIRSPSAGAIRTKRGINGQNRSDESAPLSTSSPVEGSRPNHFSPYSRPVNAPGPRQCAAFAPPASNGRRHGTASTGYEGSYGSGHFTPETLYQPPGMPIAYLRSHSLSQHYPTPAPSLNSMAPAPIYMAPHPPSQNGPSPPSHYAPAPYTEPSPFRFRDYLNPVPAATWSQPTILPPPMSLQTQRAYPYPAGSLPASNSQPSQHLAHTHPGGTFGATSAPNNSVPPHMVPYLNPDHSPPMSQFREGSQSFGSVGSGSDGSPGSNSPQYTTDQYSTEFMSALVGNGAGVGVKDGGLARKVSPRTTLDTSITGSSSGPTIASSKLVPLTPLAHPARDPEDKRVLDLLSRSAAGGQGSGDAGSVASAGGLGPGMGEEGDDKLDE